MLAKTHIAFAFLVGIISIAILNPQNQILFLILLLFAALLPDIDHPKSKLGSKIKIIGWLFKHRGFFHSIIALILFSLLAFYIFNQKIYFWAVLIGYSSHLLTDIISKQGLILFYPFSKKRLRGFIKTGGLLEFILFLAFLALGIIKLLA